jgi:hypothetical protein
MSVSKKDQVFPTKSAAITDTELARLIATGLRTDYGDSTSAIKVIGLKTGASLRAIKNWYSGKNTPSSSHLLTLARSSPSILQIVLEQIGGTDLRDAFALLNTDEKKSAREKPRKITEKFFRIEVELSARIAKNLNQRQLWFLTRLGQGEQLKSSAIATEWGVTDRSARADVAALADLELIKLAGSRKAGWYVRGRK